jgi:hypothetical protein
MLATSPWKSVALGLTLKLVAMWMILPSMLFPFAFPTHLGVLFAALFPLLIDLVGRCCCARAPVTETLPIKLSILAQCTGVLGLTVMSIFLGLGGVVLGLAWAAVFQVSAAKWFIRHLKAIALNIGQPTIAVGLDQLRQRLIATTLSVYGSGVISIVVLSCAIFFGLMAFGIGLLITIPLAFLILMPLIMPSMVLYFLMLYSYERYLSELRRAIYSQSETNT